MAISSQYQSAVTISDADKGTTLVAGVSVGWFLLSE